MRTFTLCQIWEIRNYFMHNALRALVFLLFALLWPVMARAQGPGALSFDARSLDFSLFKLGGQGPAVLVVGGIQGDEPGGFSAATLLATHYEVTSGSLWVVPNLNYPSIVLRSRAPNGDMNRKFLRLSPDDPEYNTVSRIQSIITSPEVVLVLNLHDGSGFYRHKFENRMYCPARWGQSIIVDLERMEADSPHGNLAEMAEKATSRANRTLIAPHHLYHVKNTRTPEGNSEMEKTLSWFAVRNGKSAFGVEASKEFPAEIRAYYHLRIVEAFLDLAGVKFKRKFELNPKSVAAALQSDISVAFADNRVVLPLENARPRINNLPLPRDGGGRATASKPIIAVVSAEDDLCVHYGNRRVTCIQPVWHETDSALERVPLVVDGRRQNVVFGQTVPVRDFFMVESTPGYRVNAIGFDSGREDESNLKIGHKNFMPHFSLDKAGVLYRVEVYSGSKFTGMFLVRFSGRDGKKYDMLPAVVKRESALGY